jgi:outer membrane murein-binding lipoprotein Lpp
MDTKILLVGVLVGVLLGAGVSYGIVSPQLMMLQSQVNILTTESEKVTTLQQQINAAIDQKIELQNQVTSLQSQLTTKTDENNRLNSQISTMNDQIINLQKIANPVNPPKITPPAGTYGSYQTIYMNTTTKDAKIFFTKDGSDPTSKSSEYKGPIEIYFGETVIRAITVTGSLQSNVTTQAYFIDVPLGETGGLQYADSTFSSGNFREIEVNATIYDEPDNHDGLYLQFYQSTINGIGFYFGIQTAVYRSGVWGRGVIFSRWDTSDLGNALAADGGWSDSGDDYGSFVGVRQFMAWTSHSYEFRLSYNKTDSGGDWYSLRAYDLSASTEVFIGSLRFPIVPSDQRGIAGWCTTWIEIYFKYAPQTPVPSWHVSIDGIFGVDQFGAVHRPNTIRSVYSSIKNTDTYYDPVTGKIHFFSGPRIEREHPAAILYTH